MQIILASASPRRKQLLEQIGAEFLVWPAKGEEIITKDTPADAVQELAEEKAKEIASAVLSVQEAHPDMAKPQDYLIIGADTSVVIDGHMLGKPKDEEDAKRMLQKLSGRTHAVYTGVALLFLDAGGRAGEKLFYEKTDVTFYPLSEEEIDAYVSTGEPMDKAGSYGIQGRFAVHVKGFCGDYQNVVGLPVARLYQELKALGVHL